MILENLESFQEGITKQGGITKNILKLKSIRVGEKEIYPLVKVIELNKTSLHARSIEPIALLVVENNGKYLISLDENQPSPELLDLVSI